MNKAIAATTERLSNRIRPTEPNTTDPTVTPTPLINEEHVPLLVHSTLYLCSLLCGAAVELTDSLLLPIKRKKETELESVPRRRDSVELNEVDSSDQNQTERDYCSTQSEREREKEERSSLLAPSLIRCC